VKRMILIGLLVAGCKQGKGDRCQVAADCGPNLVCNQATNTCQETTGGGIDATVPDGPRGDAAVDALGDAPTDTVLGG
jgi:hypothetical protein